MANRKRIALCTLMAGMALLFSCGGQKMASSGKPAPSGTETWTAYDLRFVNYNVENLFDLIDDPQKEDEDFLPWGVNNWNQERLQTKLKRIFKVFANVSAWEYPGIITLTEIENRNVLEYLLSATPLSEADYNIIHEESPDPRGIDVAMLYRQSFFRPIRHEAMRVVFPFDSSGRTRDILYVEGMVHRQDTLHIFACHFPSRRGGEATSEPRRIHVASMVRAKIDSILGVNPSARIIVTGDFNDEPDNASMREVLRGRERPEDMQPGDLYNMMYPMHKMGYGSYKFQASWNMLDQFLISQALLDTANTVYTQPGSAVIYKPQWLEVVDDAHPGTKPFRTYSGPNYLGGYSDHFPTYMDLYFRRD